MIETRFDMGGSNNDGNNLPSSPIATVANDAAIIGELRRGLSDDAAYLSSAGQRQKQEHCND